MAAGDVTAQIVENATATAIDTAVTNLRFSGGDHWLMTPLNNGHDVLIVHVEEL